MCEVCTQPISKARLEAVPWARLCRDCKEHQQANPAEEADYESVRPCERKTQEVRDVARQIASFDGVKRADVY